MSEFDFTLPSGRTDDHATYLRWVLGLLPPDICGFCETHSASPEIIVNLPIAKVESQNDIGDEVSGFFRAMRERGDEFGECLMTPDEPCPDEHLTRARAFFDLALWGRFAGVGRAPDKSWSDIFPHIFMPEESRFEREFGPLIPNLREVVVRLKMIALDARPADEIMKIYARPNILRLVAPKCRAEIGEGIATMAFDTPGEVLLIMHSEVADAAGWIGKVEEGWFLAKNPELSLFAVGNYDPRGLTPNLLSELRG